MVFMVPFWHSLPLSPSAQPVHMSWLKPSLTTGSPGIGWLRVSLPQVQAWRFDWGSRRSDALTRRPHPAASLSSAVRLWHAWVGTPPASGGVPIICWCDTAVVSSSSVARLVPRRSAQHWHRGDLCRRRLALRQSVSGCSHRDALPASAADRPPGHSSILDRIRLIPQLAGASGLLV